MAQTYPGLALAPSPYFFAYPAPPSSSLLPSSSSSPSSSALPSSGLFRFEKPGHSALSSHGASTTSPSHYGQSHSPSVAGSTPTRPRGRTFLVQHHPAPAAPANPAGSSPGSAKRRIHPQPLRLSQTNKSSSSNNNNNNNRVEQFSTPLSYVSGPTSSTRFYTFPSTPLSVAPVPSISPSLPSASVSSSAAASHPSSQPQQHAVYSAGAAAARRRSSAATGGTFYRQQQHPRSAASPASYHSRNPSYYAHSGNRDYAVMQLVQYPSTPVWGYGRHDTSQNQHQHHDATGLSQSQIGKRKRAPNSYALTEDPREALDDDSDRLRKSQRPSAVLPEEVPAEAEMTVCVKEEVVEDGAEQMLVSISSVVPEDQASASSSPNTASSNAVSSATSLAVHSFPLQYPPGRPHSSAELRPANPEEARGSSTIIGRRPVSAPMQSNASSSAIPAAASGLPSYSAIPSPPSTHSKAFEALSAVSNTRKDPAVLRRSAEGTLREPAQVTRPGSKSVSTGSALPTSAQQSSSTTLAHRRGQLAQDKARNLSIATSASQNTISTSNNLRTAPANQSYHQPQPSPTIAKTFSQARTSNVGPNTPRRASFAAPPSQHTYHHYSKSTATPLLPHHQQHPAHHPQFLEGRPGPAFIPPSAGFVTHHRPTHHIPPLPLAHLQGPGLATPATGPILGGGPGPHALSRPTKAVFMQDMEALYDSLPDSRAIQAHIDHMLDNAAANIGREIEDARNKRVEWEETMMKRTELFEQNVTAELQLLEKKIARLEGGKIASNAGAGHNDANAASHSQSTIQALLRRVEELEAVSKARNTTSSPRMNHRNSISRLPAISGDDHHTTRPMSSLRET